MIDTAIESMGGGRPKASTDTDQRVMTKGTGPLPPRPTRGDNSPDRRSLPLTKPSTLSRGTRPGRELQLYLLQVHPSHGPPPGPVVEAAIPPHVQLVPNLFIPQNRRKTLIFLPAEVPLPGSQHGADMVVL